MGNGSFRPITYQNSEAIAIRGLQLKSLGVNRELRGYTMAMAK